MSRSCPWLFSLALILFFPLAGEGQLLEQLRSNYRAVRARLEADLRAFDVFETDWQAALDSVGAAKSRGDDDARNRAYIVAQTLSTTRSQNLQSLDDIRATLLVARDNLKAVLLREISGLEVAYDTTTRVRQTRIDDVIASMEQEIRTLDLEEERPQVIPIGITIDAIDRPEDILLKAELLEDRADRAEQNIQDISNDLNDLNRRLRRQRSRRDVRSARDRFDAARVPVGGSAQSGTEGVGNAVAAADSLGVRAPQTLEEEIQLLETFLAELISRRDELRGRARNFRRLVGGQP